MQHPPSPLKMWRQGGDPGEALSPRPLDWIKFTALGLAIACLAAIWAQPNAALPKTFALGLAISPLVLIFALHNRARIAWLLIVLVVLQDWLVGLGLSQLQVMDEALVLLGLASLAAGIVLHRRFTTTPLDIPSLCFIGAGIIGALLAQIPAIIAAFGLLALLKGLLAFQITGRLSTDGQRDERGLAWLILLSTALAAIALLQRFGGSSVYALMGRQEYFDLWQGGKAPSIFYNHNALGHVLVFGFALALAWRLAGPAKAWQRASLNLATLIIFGGIIVSASRESWVGAAAGLLFLALLMRSRKILPIALVGCGLLFFGGIAVYFSSDLMRAEIARRSAGVVDGYQDYQLGFQGWKYRGEYRVYIILKSWEVFQDYPVWGTGPGRFGGHIAVRYPTPIYEDYQYLPLNGAFIPLDVFWSRLLTEFGLVGSAFFIWALLRCLRIFIRAARAEEDSPILLRTLGMGGLMVWAASICFGVFAPSFEDPLSAIPFWAWAGLTWAHWQGYQKSLSQAHEDLPLPNRDSV